MPQQAASQSVHPQSGHHRHAYKGTERRQLMRRTDSDRCQTVRIDTQLKDRRQQLRGRRDDDFIRLPGFEI